MKLSQSKWKVRTNTLGWPNAHCGTSMSACKHIHTHITHTQKKKKKEIRQVSEATLCYVRLFAHTMNCVSRMLQMESWTCCVRGIVVLLHCQQVGHRGPCGTEGCPGRWCGAPQLCPLPGFRLLQLSTSDLYTLLPHSQKQWCQLTIDLNLSIHEPK